MCLGIGVGLTVRLLRFLVPLRFTVSEARTTVDERIGHLEGTAP